MTKNLTYIWSQFHKQLYGYILKEVQDADTAKDILQDSFIKIQMNIEHLKEEKSMKYWIFTIVKNSIADHFRKNVYTDSISGDENWKDDDWDKNISTEKLSECIIPFVNCLPQKYKEALTLTEFQNYSQIELAKQLGISYSGAKSRVQRAKVKLKELFEECCNITADQYGNILDYSPRKFCCNKKTC